MIMDNRFLVARRRYDPDATRYINAVQLADGQALEPEVAMAVDAFIKGCKADGIWDALKASCILCGARTISGALVPLVGTAPTPYNFVAADYDRSGGGLKGDGSTKYLSVDTPSEYLQDDAHVSVFVSQPVTASGYVVAAAALASRMYENFGSSVRIRMNEVVFNQIAVSPMPAGYLAGMSRQSSESYDVRIGGINYDGVVATSSTKPADYNFFGYPSLEFADCRLSFYSLGPALDLAALDARVSTLVAAIAAAI